MDYLLVLILSTVVIAVLLYIISAVSSSGKKPGPGTPKIFRTCPLCGTSLSEGERVKSAVFPGKPDQLTHIFGCPYCYPHTEKCLRRCPVCKQTIPREGYCIARMFKKPEKIQVHVLGCTECRKRNGRKSS